MKRNAFTHDKKDYNFYLIWALIPKMFILGIYANYLRAFFN